MDNVITMPKQKTRSTTMFAGVGESIAIPLAIVVLVALRISAKAHSKVKSVKKGHYVQ